MASKRVRARDQSSKCHNQLPSLGRNKAATMTQVRANSNNVSSIVRV